MKIDTHVHSMGISKCSKVTYQQLIDQKIKAGYNGVCLMNHCQPWYYERGNFSSWVKDFLYEYDQAYDYGKQLNFKVFLGIEVSVSIPEWADFLLFGVTKEFLINAPDLCRITQEELYNYCSQNGVLMVQAHPFRINHSPQDPAFMDGVEINCQPIDIDNKALVEEFAKNHKLLITAGTDYHAPYENDIGGIIVNSEISDSVQLANAIKQSKNTQIFIGDKLFEYSTYIK